MIKLAITAAVMLAGCTTATAVGPASYADPGQMAEKQQEIAGREQRCKEAALRRTNDETARIAAPPDAVTEQRIRNAQDQKMRQLSLCEAVARRETDQLISRERTEYEAGAQEERDRASLMSILTTSRPR